MGYRSYWTLTVMSPGYVESDIINEFRAEYEDANYAFNENGEPEADMSWYDAKEELCEFSKKYPDILFLLEQNGDDPEHWDYHYVKNGMYQTEPLQMVWGDFDELKLKEP